MGLGAMLSITSVCKASVGYQRDSYGFICGFKMESHGIHGQSMELHGNQEEEKEEDEVKNRDRQRGESERKRGKKNEKER